MASGDTKTEAMLNALGNGGSADEFRGCCNTKTQQYILDAIDRVQNVEDEVEELKNNPDVVDIVDTYADLQAYDTQHLTENDIIRVLQDETHSGNSTYYRFTKNPDTWTFIGESASAGGDIKTLSTDDYNYPTNNPDRVALWLLPNGLYRIPTSGVSVYYASNSIWTFGHGDFVIIEKFQAGAKPISMYFFGSTDGVEYCEVSTSGHLDREIAYTLLSDRVSQSTGNDQYSVMSQNAVTSMVFADPSDKTKVLIGNNAGSSAYATIGIGSAAKASSARAIAIGAGALATQSCGIALGAGSNAAHVGEMNIGVPNLTGLGYNNSDYRLLTGLHDPVNAHDAATKGYVDSQGGGVTPVQATGTSTTDVMSQDATTKLIYPDIANSPYKIVIGEGAINGTNKGLAINGVLNTGLTGGSIAIGATDGSTAQIGQNGRADLSVAIGNVAGVGSGMQSVAIGTQAYANSGQKTGDNVALGYSSYAGMGSATSTVALGAYAQASRTGVVNIGTGSNGTGYNNTNYRVLGGVHDGQLAQDAVTVNQVNSVIDAINTAISTNIPHIGA